MQAVSKVTLAYELRNLVTLADGLGSADVNGSGQSGNATGPMGEANSGFAGRPRLSGVNAADPCAGLVQDVGKWTNWSNNGGEPNRSSKSRTSGISIGHGSTLGRLATSPFIKLVIV